MTTPFDCHDANQRLVIALGDPAGIGMEVTLKALADPQRPATHQPTAGGLQSQPGTHGSAAQRTNTAPVADPDDLEVDDQPIPGGPLEARHCREHQRRSQFPVADPGVQLVQQGRDVHW